MYVDTEFELDDQILPNFISCSISISFEMFMSTDFITL